MSIASLPAGIALALDAPIEGARRTIHAAGIPWSAIGWGAPTDRPLLLIHGVTSSARNWWRVGPALAASGRHVVAVDLPGHGQTGHWTGHFRFRDNARDVVEFVRAAGLASPDLQVVGHSWGAMTAAALPAAGLAPATIVLLDPPALPYAVIGALANDPSERTYDDLDEARAAIRQENPAWADGDVDAKAWSLIDLDEAAARSVLLDNGDWDGGLHDLADPAAADVPVWVIRGDPAAGGYLADAPFAALTARVGEHRVHTIHGGPHSPHRTHPVETTAAILHALED